MGVVEPDWSETPKSERFVRISYVVLGTSEWANGYTNGRVHAQEVFPRVPVTRNVSTMNTANDAFTASLARVLRHELLDARITKKALAEESEIGLRTLDRYLDGTRAIPMDSFWRICKALGVPAADVFEDAERALNKDS